MFRVSSSSSGFRVGAYRCVPLGCPRIRQAVRSLSAYFSRATSTACRRRSGLTSFPGLYPAAPVSQATGRPPASSACRSRSQAASGVWPGPPQARHTLCSSGSSLLRRPGFLAGHGNRLALSLQHLNLAKLRHDLLRRKSLPGHLLSPFQCDTLIASGSEKAGQVS